VILQDGEFLTASYDETWAVRHAEEHAIRDRRQGIDADVRVLEAA
jgi:pyrimidine deaminase RibD-like protein